MIPVKRACVVLATGGFMLMLTQWILLAGDQSTMKLLSKYLPTHQVVEKKDTPSFPKMIPEKKLGEIDEVPPKLSEQCLESNICKNPNKRPDIYYYNRTDFDTLLALPVNISANINHSQPVVPRKVHFTLFSNGSMTFKFHNMIGILAASRFVKPEKIYFWHDNLPIGKYWEETKSRVNNLYLVHRERPTSIYGNVVKVVEHVADIVRLEALLEYGGMYFDTDSIVVNPIDPLLIYDVTMGYSASRVLSNGMMFSKPWSDFFKIWHREYKTFDDHKWGAYSVVKPYTLSKRYPNLIHIEPTSLCRPHFMELEYLFGPNVWDWQHNNYVVHLYMRYSHGKGSSAEEIKSWNTTVGSIMRYIYFSDPALITIKK